RFARFVCDYNEKFGIQSAEAEDIYKKAEAFLKNKKVNKIDIPEVRYLKGLIRKGEARATAHFVGLPDEQIHFMELPFYETGTIE
ncbi:glucosamine-6-phosphate deaminase, partial [Flavobacterium aquariorum]